MALSVKVTTSAEHAPPDLVAVGVPVVATGNGPKLPEGLPPSVGGFALPETLDPRWCERHRFKAKVGEVLDLHGLEGPGRLLVGLGDEESVDEESWRRAAASFVRASGAGGSALLVVPQGCMGLAPADLGDAVTVGAILGSYRFDSYRSKRDSNPSTVERLDVCAGPLDEVEGGVRRGTIFAAATSFARDLVNTPPSDLTPLSLAAKINEVLSHKEGVTLQVWDEERIADERLGGLVGVSRGSNESPRLLRADYTPKNPVEVNGRIPYIALVGKGITFDSGGLSLKTAEGMTTMKTDMSGAAVVMAVLSVCSDLDVRVRVSAIAPVTENMPGGSAIKPGDVVTIRNGKTIEVLNTDAEGRLVLADALVLATELLPDAIVDVATLTGAAVVALGTEIAPIFGTDAALVDQICMASKRSGEKLWRMPLPDEYQDHIDSEVADMKNVGKPGQAGSIAAALLLREFTGDVAWAHLDIAGPARSSELVGYNPKGGTGFGVRTLLELLARYGEPSDDG
ncbi:MAG: leucyl aminopeptidase [Actinobacteria bacterium]|nr:leucyl aminopeptidase [Actinomycetota bacterium]